MFILITALIFTCPESKEYKEEHFFPQTEYFKAKDYFYEQKDLIGTIKEIPSYGTCTLTDVKSGSRKLGMKK
jgi:hypothetical protein